MADDGTSNMHLFAYGFGSYAQFETTNCGSFTILLPLTASGLGWPPFMDCVIGIAVQVTTRRNDMVISAHLNTGSLRRSRIPPQREELVHPHHCRRTHVSSHTGRPLQESDCPRLVSFAGGTGTVISFIHLQSESQAGVGSLGVQWRISR